MTIQERADEQRKRYTQARDTLRDVFVASQSGNGYTDVDNYDQAEEMVKALDAYLSVALGVQLPPIWLESL